jgi:hypothetical protein
VKVDGAALDADRTVRQSSSEPKIQSEVDPTSDVPSVAATGTDVAAGAAGLGGGGTGLAVR